LFGVGLGGVELRRRMQPRRSIEEHNQIEGWGEVACEQEGLVVA